MPTGQNHPVELVRKVLEDPCSNAVAAERYGVSLRCVDKYRGGDLPKAYRDHLAGVGVPRRRGAPTGNQNWRGRADEPTERTAHAVKRDRHYAPADVRAGR